MSAIQNDSEMSSLPTTLDAIHPVVESALSGQDDIARQLPHRSPVDMTDGERLFSYTDELVGNAENHFIVGYDFLHNLNIIAFQHDIARLENDILKHKSISRLQINELRELLSDYTTAIKNYGSLRNLSVLSGYQTQQKRNTLEVFFNDLSTLESQPLRSHYYYISTPGPAPAAALNPISNFLRRKLPPFLSYSDVEKRQRRSSYANCEPPEDISPFVDWLARFTVAVIPGIALVVPMAIMLFHSSRVKGLVTIIIAILLISFCMVTFMQASLGRTLASTATYTAAYAAVLVVFLGISA